jgi:hypothetical protein
VPLPFLFSDDPDESVPDSPDPAVDVPESEREFGPDGEKPIILVFFIEVLTREWDFLLLDFCEIEKPLRPIPSEGEDMGVEGIGSLIKK